MKIWTTYFANIKKLDLDKVVPISICGKAVDGWQFPQYKKLAPSWSIYKEYKDSGDKERYTRRFIAEILSELDPSQVINDLIRLAGEERKDIALVCYEKPGDFCHRHLVADWLGKFGIKVLEYGLEENS